MIRFSLFVLATTAALLSTEIVQLGWRANANAVPRYQEVETLSRQALLDLTEQWRGDHAKVLIFGIDADPANPMAESLYLGLENAVAANGRLGNLASPELITLNRELGLQPIDAVNQKDMVTFARNMGADMVLTGSLDRTGWVELKLFNTRDGKMVGQNTSIIAMGDTDLAKKW